MGNGNVYGFGSTHGGGKHLGFFALKNVKTAPFWWTALEGKLGKHGFGPRTTAKSLLECGLEQLR